MADGLSWLIHARSTQLIPVLSTSLKLLEDKGTQHFDNIAQLD